MSAKAATIYDVARLAGVSHQTVSRYLAGFTGIRPETGSRVQHALDELRYRPNATARLLRTRSSNRVAVLAHRIDFSGPARMLAGATQAAQRLGYMLDVVIVDELDRDAIDEALAVATEHHVVGILATAQTEIMLERIEHHAAAGVPVIIDSRIEAFPDGPTVSTEAGLLAAEHLLALGHRRVGYLSGPLDWIAAVERRDGFRTRFEHGGGTIVWNDVGDWSAASGFAAWDRIAHAMDGAASGLTAVGAGNDSMAIGLMAGAHAAGVRIPADISVIGGDDLAEAPFVVPALTSVVVDFPGEGRYLMERLLGVAEPEWPEPLRVVVRESTRAV